MANAHIIDFYAYKYHTLRTIGLLRAALCARELMLAELRRRHA